MEDESSFWLDNAVGIASLIIVLVTFGTERYFTYKRERQSDQYNWFLNIIVQPNLKGIEENYSTILEMLKEAMEELGQQSEKIPLKEYLVLQRKKLNEFKRIRKTYFNNFSSLIRSYDPNLANKVDIHVNSLDDIYTESLDEIKDEGSVDELEIRSKIFKNQSTLYAILFNEIRKEN